MNGAQSEGPAFLINIHRSTTSPTPRPMSRGCARWRATSTSRWPRRASGQALGVLPPKWVFPYVIADSKNVISGAPFGAGADSALWADFKGKVGKLRRRRGDQGAAARCRHARR